MVEVDAMVDTGSPYSLILPDPMYEQFVNRYVRSLETNFGMLTGGWLRVTVPGTRLDEDVIAYGSETILRTLHQSDRRLNALVGLPLLRRLEYGGDADRFWIRDASR